jgi:hypothetical protein
VESFHSILSAMRLSAPHVQGLPSIASARVSMESTGDDWFDAQSIHGPEDGLINVVTQESDIEHEEEETSDEEDDLRAGAVSPLLTMAPKRFKGKKVLYPLGEWHGRVVKRRNTLPKQIIIPPPSLLAFLRKNVSFYAS